MGQHGGKRNPDRVLDQHVDHEKPEIVAEGIPELVGPDRVTEQCQEVLQADKDPLLVDAAVERQTQGVEQRKDHDSRIDQHGRGQKNDNMPANAGAVHAASGVHPGSSKATRKDR